MPPPVTFNKGKVLVAPLDWGLGHATRCIPLIRALTASGYEVLVAAEGAQEELLRREFPELQFMYLAGYRVKYSKARWSLPFVLMKQAPYILKIIAKEQAWLKQTIKEHNISLVISDNRYGLYSDSIPAVFITHQLTIKAPFSWLEKLLRKINYRYINRFTACWVPDMAVTPVAGVLSHPSEMPDVPVHYMGLLARFEAEQLPVIYDQCIVLSGPEPQRTLLEKFILKDLPALSGKTVLVRGKPGDTQELNVPNHVTVYNHLDTATMARAFVQSDLIICRSGYTTVMELLQLRKKALLIPTPGQTEQEYLAHTLMESGFCFSVTQQELKLLQDTDKARTFSYRFTNPEIFNGVKLQQLLAELNR
ncbi:glycosyltransferase [Sediminibacterium ginsengisoli]|uniref:Glycosyl transferase family 28 C-terminal domain-containing protein n=1 Tax=Sediminibacterium ginsengisoli TaxID=413434 RepID=A0A1T4MIN0_9BACT|nr:glycosyltransferase [Sediminibacterium ginsengisoli]SJZ66812.1 conserved hypothetical protein [Sediminibacterium ginsengisoli]